MNLGRVVLKNWAKLSWAEFYVGTNNVPYCENTQVLREAVTEDDDDDGDDDDDEGRGFESYTG